jgi:hypothetical protein
MFILIRVIDLAADYDSRKSHLSLYAELSYDRTGFGGLHGENGGRGYFDSHMSRSVQVRDATTESLSGFRNIRWTAIRRWAC